MYRKMRNHGTTILLVAALLIFAAPAMAEPAPSTPFVIDGYVHEFCGDPCNGTWVRITNTNTSEYWDARNSSESNCYLLMLDSDCVSAGDILRFDATDGTNSSVTDHTVTADEVDDGGLFEFNLTLGPIPGNVNGDGGLTTADATIALQMAVRGEYSEVADVSGDRAVTSLDALMILQAVANNITL